MQLMVPRGKRGRPPPLSLPLGAGDQRGGPVVEEPAVVASEIADAAVY